uniref:Uncharacterized protein n=1 Tax=Cereibacter sphaeroides (strain ATCC 17025 / ATH 2.4.3) TaxID=349102 RepID=A4X015_CERS5
MRAPRAAPPSGTSQHRATRHPEGRGAGCSRPGQQPIRRSPRKNLSAQGEKGLFPLFPAVQGGLFYLPLFAGPAPKNRTKPLPSSFHREQREQGNGTAESGTSQGNGFRSLFPCEDGRSGTAGTVPPGRPSRRVPQSGSGGRLAATPRKELPPACDRLFGQIEKTCDILDGQTLGQKQQGVGHAGLDNFGGPGVECLPQLVAVVVGEKHLGHHTVTLAGKGALWHRVLLSSSRPAQPPHGMPARAKRHLRHAVPSV